MGCHGFIGEPSTVTELTQASGGIIREGLMGITQGWDIPVAVWRYQKLWEQHISAHNEIVLSIFHPGSLMERTDGHHAGRRGGNLPSSIALNNGTEARTYVALHESVVTHFYIKHSFLSNLASETAVRYCSFDNLTENVFEIYPYLRRCAAEFFSRATNRKYPPSKLEMDTRSILLGINILSNISQKQHKLLCNERKFSVREIGKILDIIESNLHHDVSIQEMADEMDYSLSYFLFLFKRTFNISPHQYLIERRVARAQCLMLSSMSLSQIALDCGFNSQQHFSSTFRRVIGVTPSAWKSTAAEK